MVAIHVKPFGNAVPKSTLDYLNFGVQNYLARIAVPFFFIAAGFFLFKKTSVITAYDVRYSLDYVKRIIRLYLVWTVIHFPFRIRTMMVKGFVPGLLGFIRDFFFNGSYPHLWFLPALAVGVLLTSFFLYKGVQPRTIIVIASCLYFVGLFAQSWFGFIKPLKYQSPEVWGLLKIIQIVMVTTRNGVFEGFLFVSIGMLFSQYNFEITRRKAVVGFIISMILMFVEVFVLQFYDFIRAYDMYFFLVPAAFFMFYLAINIELPDNPIYKTMRTASSLIFYSHLWVYWIIYKALKILFEPLAGTWIQFVFTLLITIAVSVLVMRLSELKRFKWMKALYA